MSHEPKVTRFGAIDMQVCVPAEWTDAEAIRFAESQYPCGTKAGWSVRTDPRLLNDDPVRQPCAERTGCVHVMLDA